MSRLLLVRHGHTVNGTERLCGHDDVALSETGMKQAEQLRRRLTPTKIDAIYSSDLKRALVTAETIASERQTPVIASPGLREVNFGQLEGLTFPEITQLHPELVQLWREASLDLKFPDGESFYEFNSRVCQFLSQLAKHALEETILIVAHSGPLRLLVCRLLGIGLEHWWQIRLGLASLTIMETYPQGVMLTRLNDVSHLEA